MDQRECIVISDTTSVQPVCCSRVDLSIIRLVTEAVEAEVAVGIGGRSEESVDGVQGTALL